MRSIFNKALVLLALMATPIIFFTGCEEDDNEVLELYLAFENTVDGNDIQTGQTYTANGRSIDFDIINYYISNVRIMDDSGNMILSNDEVFLAKEGNANSFKIGEFQESQHAHMVMFTLGVEDTTVNLGDPSQYGSDHPLSTSQGMHWSWNSGYIFLKVEGEVDTTATPDGNLDEAYIYHLGTDNLKKEVSVMVHTNVDQEGANTITLDFDLATALQNVDFNDGGELDSHTMNNMPTAMKIMNDAQGAFSKRN